MFRLAARGGRSAQPFLVSLAVVTALCTTQAEPGLAAGSVDPFDVCSRVVAAPETSDGKSDTLWIATPSNAPLRIGSQTFRSVYFNSSGTAWLGTQSDGTYLLAADSPVKIAVADLDWTTDEGGFSGATSERSGTGVSICVVWNVQGSTQGTDEKTRIEMLLTWDSTAGNPQVRTRYSGYMTGMLEGRTLSTSGTLVYDQRYVRLDGIAYNISYQNQFWLLPNRHDEDGWVSLRSGDKTITATWPWWTGEQSTFTANFNEVRTGKFIGSCSTTAPATGCTMSGLSNQVEYVSVRFLQKLKE